MDRLQIVNTISRILDEAKTAVLGTLDETGRPHMRWMTPALVRGRPSALYAVTSPKFGKVLELAAHPRVQWLIQTPSLTEVVAVNGTINVLDNPAVKSEILEAIGSRLRVFWKINPESSDLVVLETVIEEATYFLPMRGTRETVSFAQES